MKDFSLVIYRFENNYTVDDSYKLLLTAPEKAKDVLAYCFYNYLKSMDDECETFSEKMDSFIAEIKDFNTNKNWVFGEIEISVSSIRFHAKKPRRTSIIWYMPRLERSSGIRNSSQQEKKQKQNSNAFPVPNMTNADTPS